METGASGRGVTCLEFPFEHMPETISVRDLYNSRSLDGWSDRGNTYSAEDSVRGRSCKVLRVAKSMMLGDEAGMLKLLFDPENPTNSLGVHALGQRATEIIHIGPGRTLLWRISGIFPGHGLQLSNTRRSVQSSRLKRTKTSSDTFCGR